MMEATICEGSHLMWWKPLHVEEATLFGRSGHFMWVPEWHVLVIKTSHSLAWLQSGILSHVTGILKLNAMHFK